MYLQSLEMIGFKSFAPRTVLNFHRGVTAVVGPNGCGKSNVLDAVRWVLGEQSAKALRGGEMADVIFSGTDSRPALGMAEVTLAFADCERELGVEWNEVAITRRVFRDGRSEYFLNKTPCRLRDIHQLFMDTGVGRSAYSIMEQGKIDLILSSRPEDRRAIFEEAAGITKYKAQKKEALRKLEYTEANLLRVQDIIKEVRRQIGSLQRQAAKARRYQALMRDLRIVDTHFSHRNYRQLDAELGEVRGELSQAEKARAIHETEIAQQDEELQGLRARVEELDAQVAAVRDEVQVLRSRLFAADSRLTTNGERCEEARVQIDRYGAEIAGAGEKIRSQEDQIAQTDALLNEMIETLRAREAAQAEQAERVRAARDERVASEAIIDELVATIARLEGRLGSLRNEISAAAGRREAGETRLRLLQGESDAAALAAEEFAGRLADVSNRAVAAAAAAQAAQTAQAQAQAAFEVAQDARQAAEATFNAISKEAAGIESRLEILRQLQEMGEGFDEGTQAVLKGLDNPDFFKAAIQGALADAIEVDHRFIPAIEAALGAGLQAIIFKDVGVAEAALQTLSAHKLGRAAIVPREWIDGLSAPAAGELPEGALAWAGACVKGGGEAGVLAQRLLEKIVVAENLEAAFRLRTANPTLGVATLTGEFLSPHGVALGGRTGEHGGQSVLARKAQIAGLEGELAEVIGKLEFEAGRRNAALEDLEVAQERLLSARENCQRAQVESASVANEEKLASRQLADLNARRATYVTETVQLGESLRACVAQIEGIETAIAETGRSLEEARARRVEAERAISTVRERESAAAESLADIRIRVATERQQQENLARQRGPMAARIAELAEILAARRADIASLEGRIGGLNAESAGLKESMAGWEAEVQEREARIAQLGADRAEVHGSMEAIESVLRSARQELSRLHESAARLEVRAAQVDMRKENLRDHVSHRYQVDLAAFEPDSYALLCTYRERNKKKGSEEEPGESSAPQDADRPETAGAAEEEGVSWDRLEEIVAELSERVDAMGPVNLEAIQEYDELEQRQQFLENQNNDLTNSKTELLAVISRINRTTRELFAETFEKVRENFQVMFAELFGGGRANLLLVDENDPLESGIEIIARPPGKQLQSISLLSGGERTMTAVSLLFAIYMVKPSPFCILDEMDAPLDESNINRFIKILDRFVDQSQFVVITHNKRTISRADMLYGVTMEEHGISKLVSVRFSSKEAAAPSRSIADSFGKDDGLLSERQAAGTP